MRIRRPTSAALARVVCAIAAVLTLAAVALTLVLVLDSSYEPVESAASGLSDLLMVLAFAVVGGILTLKRPDNLVGWALVLSGVGSLIGGVPGVYAELALLAKPEAGLPGGAAAAAVSSGSWTTLIAGVFLLLVVFPAGRIPSRRWRVVTTFVLSGFAAVWFLIATSQEQLDAPFDAFENPLALAGSNRPVEVFFWIVNIAVLFCVVLAAIGLLRRFRRSRGEERQQFKWLAASAGLLVVTFPIAGFFEYSDLAGAAFSVALVALPVSVGIAIFRYHLYDLDLVARRTVVYGALSALLAGLYFGIVLTLQEVFSSFAGGSDLAIAISTLAVAALFQPARGRVQTFVDRRFYRRRYDAQRTLETFSARLRDEIDLDTLRGELGTVVEDTMQPTHVTLWLRTTGGDR
jgi:hypothetical protein